MCGIAGCVRADGLASEGTVRRMIDTLAHRGPDDEGVWIEGKVGLGTRRLAILDLSPAGRQPMACSGGRFVIAYNGEVYNYLELRCELGGTFRTGTDTEVVLHAIQQWGAKALDRLNGMFALAMWDTKDQTLLLARDRFGVKPLYYAEWGGAFYFASEIKALAAAGVPLEPDAATWALYLSDGVYDHSERTFFKGIFRLRPGYYLRWKDGRFELFSWYDLAEQLAERHLDSRPEEEVAAEYAELLTDAVRLRFRSDVPVGVCLSGGLDSAMLVGIFHRLFGWDTEIHAYHFATGDPNYDETPWVKRLLARSRYPLHLAQLRVEEVSALTEEVSYHQEEPFGGVPTLAMARLFHLARTTGTVVLLDGQGLDEQWGGYDYYAHASVNCRSRQGTGVVQGSRLSPTRPECLTAEFRRLVEPVTFPMPFRETLRNWCHRDLRFTKIPRALRFSDRTSSQASCELREPFLDHRLVALAFRQPADRLIRHGQHKYLLRRIARSLLPQELAEAPKRSVQTPQREWLRGPLRDWVEACLDHPAVRESGWFDSRALRREWEAYLQGKSDNSFYIWQWISVAQVNGTVVQRLGSLSSGS